MSDRLDRLTGRLRAETGLVTAFSGGADSGLLAAVAHQVLGARALAVTAVSASLPGRERADARQFARTRRLPQIEVCTDELDRADYVRNGADRCFHCKSALMDALVPVADAMAARVALGTNVDDLADYRPGQRAAAARGAVFPLVDAGLTKADVRELSRELGLPTAAKPAAACLASRVAYGDPVTAPVLARIERAEDLLKDWGISRSRVRAHADGTVARIEVPPAEFAGLLDCRDELVEALRREGFTFVALDLAGLRSGSMNLLLVDRASGHPVTVEPAADLPGDQP